MTPNNLKISRHMPGLLEVAVSRPKALNALNTQTLNELAAVLAEAAQDSSVRVVILTGEGEKSFIAGADIVEMQGKDVRDAVEFSKLGHTVARLLESMPKPTIAAVNGFALGGGCEMAMACDFILAADSASFGQPEVGLGLIPGFGGTVRLTKLIGMARAKDLIFSGRRVRAEEAARMGLVSQVFPAGEFRVKVLELATMIARNSLSAVSCSKGLINEFSESVGLNYKIDSEAHAFGRLFGTADQVEGVQAFVEKRKPIFVGVEGE